MAINYPRLLGRLTNRPLLVTAEKAKELLAVLGPRAGMEGSLLFDPETDDGPILLGDLAAGLFDDDHDRPARKAYQVIDGVARIPLQGTLVSKLGTLDPYSGMTGYDGLAFKLREAATDHDVGAIALDIESPGGEVHSQLEELGPLLAAAREAKPVWGVCTDYAYSAAYWIGCQVDRLIVPPVGGVGSIGALMLHHDITGMLDAEGIKITVLRAGARKADVNPWEALPKAAADQIKRELEEVRHRFAEVVATARGLDVDDVLGTEARCFGPEEALALGLVDDIMQPSEAYAALAEEIAAGGGNGGATGTAETQANQPKGKKAMTTKQTPRQSKAGKPPRRAEEMPPEDDEQDAPEIEDDEDATAEEPEDPDAEAEDNDAPETEDDEPAPASASAKALAHARALMGRKSAARNPGLAAELATEPGMTAARFDHLMALSGKSAGGQLGGLMPDNPRLGADGGQAPKAGSSWASAADRVFGKPATTR